MMCLLYPLMVLCIVATGAAPLKDKNQGTFQEIVIDPRFLSNFKSTAREGLASFSQYFYLQLANRTHSSMVFSPLALHSAWTLLYLGATPNSETAQDMDTTPWRQLTNSQVLKAGYKYLLSTYKEETNFQYGNSFWVEEGFRVKESFSKTAQDVFNSEVITIDFERSESVDHANQFISRQTGGNIEDIVEDFPTESNLFLASVISFKEGFMMPFNTKDPETKSQLKGLFQTPDGDKVVNMMEQRSPFIGYEEINVRHLSYEVLTIPYKNGIFELRIILPKDNNEMERIESMMKHSNDRDLAPDDPYYFNMFSMKSVSDIVDPRSIDDDLVLLKMPTFNIRHDIDAKSIFQQLGANKVN